MFYYPDMYTVIFLSSLNPYIICMTYHSCTAVNEGKRKHARNNSGALPVSYTHLDVYKRQGYSCSVKQTQSLSRYDLPKE